MSRIPITRREVIGLGVLASCGGTVAGLSAHAADEPVLAQELARLESAWGGNFYIDAQRLDAPGRFTLRADAVLPTASTCKLFVLCELFRQAEAGTIDLNAPLTWKPEHHRGGDGVLRAMVPGQALSIHNLAVLMIVLSDNIATAALVELLGSANINRSLRNWRLADSEFFDGLPGGPAQAQMKQPVSSPRDLGSLITRIYRHELLAPKSCEEIIRILRAQRVNDMLPRYIPVGEDWGHADTWIANKTGYGACRVEVGLVKSETITMSLAVFFKPHQATPHRLKSLSDYPPVLAVAHACKEVYDHFATT
jgi:beta-lactamase class A